MASPNTLEIVPRLMFGRFQLIEELGAGGQGRVVRAFDIATRREVALKLLRVEGAAAISRFKNEFRTLAGLVHPNLVRLGELFEHDSVWGFSMELVSGGDLLSWVREEGVGFHEARLRESLRQVASALHTVHGAGLIHRDLKPENLRATESGRIVVIDFGLVTARGPSARTTQKRVVGTTGYMAPELSLGELATEKSDLYAFGVILFQALTGVLPFGEGSMFQVAERQRTLPPPRPSSLEPHVPNDLDELCVALLARDPEQRPTTRELVARLTIGAPETSADATAEPRPELFFGRRRELSVLRELVGSRGKNGVRAAFVFGESGIGKTALVEQLLREVRQGIPEAILLSGRCHAAEHVPYNAFDDIVDGLARLLSGLSEWKRELVLPESAHLLPSLFPTLATIPNIGERPVVQGLCEVDRTLLFDAIIELLAGIGASFPLLLVIDDVQWADVDSLQLLRALLDRERDQNMALVLIARPEASGEIGSALFSVLEHPRVAKLELAPLDERSARALGAHLLKTSAGSERVSKLIEEAAGSPIFLIELAHAAPSAVAAPATTVDGVLRARVARLDATSRRVLSAVSAAGAPISAGVLIAALDTSVEELYGAVTVLRQGRLVRETALGELSSYHDRVREAVTADLSAAKRAALHRALAQAFELPAFEDPRRSAEHWLLAGDELRAAPRLEQAAAQAFESAVFEQAAELYRVRLSLHAVPLESEHRRALQIRLADALASAGHCSASAHILLEALVGASPELTRELRLRAAQQLLQAGELEAGTRAAAGALADVGLPWSKNSAEALLQLGLQRLKVRAARAGFRPLKGANPELLDRQLDSLVRLIHPLAWSDSLRSAELSARALVLALTERRSAHLPTLLAAEAVQVSLREPGSQAGAQLLDEAKRWLRAEPSFRERAYFLWASGATEIAHTRYKSAEKNLREAELMYRTSCPGEAWMHVNTRGMLLNAWIGGGAHREFVERSEVWIREAESKGDAHALAYYAVGGQAAFRHVMADDPDRALAEVATVMLPWQAGFGIHHFLRLKATHDILSYRGAEHAYLWWQQTLRGHPLLARSPMGALGLTPAFFSEGFAWRFAEALFRAGLAQKSAALVRKAKAALFPLARAATLYVRVFAGITAMQIALVEDQREEGRRMARTIRAELGMQDDYRAQTYDLLLSALSSPRLPEPLHWQPLSDWFAERGWKNPARAVEWILPVACWQSRPGDLR